MSCAHEHNETGGHGGCDHHNTAEEEALSAKASLYEYIDITKVRALNESEPDACKGVIKAYHERLDTTKKVSSDSDEELIIHIPFTEVVKIRSICIIGGIDGEAPDKMKAWTNREDIDFEMANGSTPTQEWEVAEESMQGQVEYATKYSKFGGVHCITLFFPSNWGADVTTLFYIGLKGETTNQKVKQELTNIVYESAPQLKDHKITDSTNPLAGVS